MKRQKFLALRVSDTEFAAIEILAARRAASTSDVLRDLIREELARLGIQIGFAEIYNKFDVSGGNEDGRN